MNTLAVIKQYGKAEETPREPEDDKEFDEYVLQFLELATDLATRRSPRLAIAPFDDSMRYDEAAFRDLDALMLNALLKVGASSRVLKLAHCCQPRLAGKPNVFGSAGQRDPKPLPYRLKYAKNKISPHLGDILKTHIRNKK